MRRVSLCYSIPGTLLFVHRGPGVFLGCNTRMSFIRDREDERDEEWRTSTGVSTAGLQFLCRVRGDQQELVLLVLLSTEQ